MLTFSQFLLCENAILNDQLILEIASFVVSKVRSILAKNVPAQNFSQELQKAWTGYYPSKEIRLKFEFTQDTDTASYQFENNEHTVSIPLGPLYEEGGPENLLQTLVHELQHVNSPGANGNNLNTIQDKLKFYGNYGEIESHAKEFGFLFHEHFPKNPFNLSLLLQLYTKLKNDKSYAGKESLYKILLYAFPTKTQEYQESTEEQKQKWNKLQKDFTTKIADYVQRFTK